MRTAPGEDEPEAFLFCFLTPPPPVSPLAVKRGDHDALHLRTITNKKQKQKTAYACKYPPVCSVARILHYVWSRKHASAFFFFLKIPIPRSLSRSPDEPEAAVRLSVHAMGRFYSHCGSDCFVVTLHKLNIWGFSPLCVASVLFFLQHLSGFNAVCMYNATLRGLFLLNKGSLKLFASLLFPKDSSFSVHREDLSRRSPKIDVHVINYHFIEGSQSQVFSNVPINAAQTKMGTAAFLVWLRQPPRQTKTPTRDWNVINTTRAEWSPFKLAPWTRRGRQNAE